MIVEQIYTGCLAQGAYYIESNGEAAVIDPLREVEPYLQRAQKNNATIKYIFETHFHADFVSGHLTLSNKTKAPINKSPNYKRQSMNICCVSQDKSKKDSVMDLPKQIHPTRAVCNHIFQGNGQARCK
mgnify:CR=1 FL=1